MFVWILINVIDIKHMLSVFIVQWNFTIYQLNRKCIIKQWNRLSVKMINAVSMSLYEYLLSILIYNNIALQLL